MSTELRWIGIWVLVHSTSKAGRQVRKEARARNWREENDCAGPRIRDALPFFHIRSTGAPPSVGHARSRSAWNWNVLPIRVGR